MAFEELKAKQSVIWGSGPYEQISAHLVPAHEHLFRVIPVREGERWLDVATGTGEIATIAAQGGAEVTGLDLAPELIDTARRVADERGLDIQYDVGDAERLPYPDASFDTVTSTFGVMFAPDQETAAAELIRVCKPGGRLALLTWHPSQGVAELFKIMTAYQPARPEGVGNPFEWGSHERLLELLGDDFDLSFAEGNAPQIAASGQEAWELFSTAYGPTKVLAESLEDERRSELTRDIVDYFEQFRTNGKVEQTRPYVLTIGQRR